MPYHQFWVDLNTTASSTEQTPASVRPNVYTQFQVETYIRCWMGKMTEYRRQTRATPTTPAPNNNQGSRTQRRVADEVREYIEESRQEAREGWEQIADAIRQMQTMIERILDLMERKERNSQEFRRQYLARLSLSPPPPTT
ncbi:unnamed protein product [Absidia cylindrospora]